jgi:hypothetical protein
MFIDIIEQCTIVASLLGKYKKHINVLVYSSSTL